MIYQVVFAFNFIMIFLIMKLLSRSMAQNKTPGDTAKFLFTGPLLSYTTFRKNTQHSEPIGFLLFRFVIITLFLGIIIYTARRLSATSSYTDVLLLSPMLYIFTEWIGAVGQLLFKPFSSTSTLHRHPLRSTNIREFWGRRWNIWVQDWLGDINRPFKRRPAIKILYTFFISGLFHEAMVNLPHLIYYREFSFGNMTAYFLIQALALWLDKQCLSQAPSMIRRLFFWLAVILPSPLFMNRSLLLFFGIIDG